MGAQVTDLWHGPCQTQQKDGHGPENKHLCLGLVCESSFCSSFLSACVLSQDIYSPSSLGSNNDVEQEGLEDADHEVSFTWLTPVTPALPQQRCRQCKGQTLPLGAGVNGPWRCDVHTRLSPFAGSYYLTTTYGVLEHIKNYDKITVTRQLSVEVQDSIHRWERRRTLNKARASRSSVQVAGIIS